jgi:hypothetical protein
LAIRDRRCVETAGGGLIEQMRRTHLLFPRRATPLAENALALNILRIANNFMEMFHAPFEMEDIG